MIEKALYNYLKSQKEITDIVGSKIYTAQLPAKITYPCLLMFTVSSNELAWNAPVPLERVQFSCYAKGKQGYIKAKELSNAVISVLNQYSGVMGEKEIVNISFDNRTQLYESELDVYLWATDFFIKYI